MDSDRWSKTWTYFQGEWHEGNVPIFGPRSHAAWLGSMVFDGARAFAGAVPDVELHCARVNESARRMGLTAGVPLEAWLDLVTSGINRFDYGAELYIRPMYWAERGGALAIAPDPESVRWCLTIYEVPLPAPSGFSITLSPFRRPTMETMPVDAKAGCLYPNNARALIEARSRGFDNCVMRDVLGNVAELSNSNLFMVRDQTVFTPFPNGTFLNGITRQRVIALLRAAGHTVEETTLHYRDFEEADEIFATSNASKVLPIARIDGRELQLGRTYQAARGLYWQYAREHSAIRQSPP